MQPEVGNPYETEGVLNPAAARGPDGHLYLFPRLVAKGNYSRIGIARVNFNNEGDPCGVERLGIALEPEAVYEKCSGGGGCEDPRVTYVEPLKHYVMTYTALSESGPRIALAISEDLLHWTRIGPAKFQPYRGIDFVNVDDKDASVFPVALPNHCGKMQLAMIHRPLFFGTHPEETVHKSAKRLIDLDHESIWLSYCPMPAAGMKPHLSGLFNSHLRLASPVSPWEILKIGGGTPPILTRHGWMILYHGICKDGSPDNAERQLRYSAGVMILSRDHPNKIVYRTTDPILVPESPDELSGTISNVVFPTGIDRRDDLGTPNRFDIYYGMADSKIGVARMELPDQLPSGSPSDSLDGAIRSHKSLGGEA